MSLILTREQESKLQQKAARMGKPIQVVLDELLEDQVPQTPTARELLTLSKEERMRILKMQSERAVVEYETDLARSITDRELTAFTALDGEIFHEHPTERTSHG